MLAAMWVFIGSGLGALGRYGLDLAVQSCLPQTRLPWATLIANVAGSALVGLVAGLAGSMQFVTGATLLIGTGFCGGLTTVSSLNVQLLALVHEHRPWPALTYGLLTVALSLSALTGGYCLGA